MTFEEKTLETEHIYRGKIINLRKDKVTVQGGISYREIVEHHGGAVLAAITQDGKMVMVRQFRKPAECVMLEAPAGKIDLGEDPQTTAKRELKEETGYTAGKIDFLTSFYPSVGYSEEVLYLYLCTDLKAGETCFDENEAIEIVEYDIPALVRMVFKREIQDAKTIIAILYVNQLLQEGKLLINM